MPKGIHSSLLDLPEALLLSGPSPPLLQAMDANDQMGAHTKTMKNIETDLIPVLAILYPYRVNIYNYIY